jgi:hypothetical protein
MPSLVEQRKSEQIAYKFRQQGTFNIRKKNGLSDYQILNMGSKNYH